jgi:hypothetical protein
MDWLSALVVFGACSIGLCFNILQWQLWRPVAKIAREERCRNPDPNRKRDAIRGITITAAVYAAIGLAFFLGWRRGGISLGAACAVAVAVTAGLAAAGYGIQRAVLRSRSDVEP